MKPYNNIIELIGDTPVVKLNRIVPQGAANSARLIEIVEDPGSGLPADATTTLKVLVAALAHLESEIGQLDAEIARQAKENEVARRLMTVPGIGPLIATALAVLALVRRPTEAKRPS